MKQRRYLVSWLLSLLVVGMLALLRHSDHLGLIASRALDHINWATVAEQTGFRVVERAVLAIEQEFESAPSTP
jgi:hypothetical protein